MQADLLALQEVVEAARGGDDEVHAILDVAQLRALWAPRRMCTCVPGTAVTACSWLASCTHSDMTQAHPPSTHRHAHNEHIRKQQAAAGTTNCKE